MAAEHPHPSEEDETVARHRALAEVLRGDRLMGWSDWTVPIYDSKCLTTLGRSVVLRAVDTLQHALGDGFLQQATAARAMHPIYSFGLWPANDVPWVYANLIQLAAQIALLDKRLRPIQRALRRNMDPTHWVHSLLQLEVAALGLKAGWQIVIEPDLGNGHRADVCLTHTSTRLLVETMSMRPSDAERNAQAFFRRRWWLLQNLEWQHSVHITGSLGNPRPPEDETQWFRQIEAAVLATVLDGAKRQVTSPEGGQLEISKEAPAPDVVMLEGASVSEDVWGRLVARLNDKNRQATDGTGPVWVRLEEYAGLWQFTPLREMTLSERLDVLAPALQGALESFPHLAGVILSPAEIWAGYAPPESLNERIDRDGGIALRSPIPGHRARESVIVARRGPPNAGIEVFADWYEHETTWLDWALDRLGHPPFDALVQEPSQ